MRNEVHAVWSIVSLKKPGFAFIHLSASKDMRLGKVSLAFSYSLGLLRRLLLGFRHEKGFGKADLVRWPP
jgi:hypothetical protein